MAETKKAVLMMHTDQGQGELWQTALASQQLEVIWENVSLDLVQVLEQYLENGDRQKLPDLLIMDMAIKSPNSETLQSSSVCQWINKQKADIKVVLFNPRQEKIKDIEHSWALRRGAADVLPRLSPQNLMAEVARVTALIGCSLIAQPIEAIAKRLTVSSTPTNSIIQIEENELASITDITTFKAEQKSNNNSASNPRSDGKEVVMYRGVRIRR